MEIGALIDFVHDWYGTSGPVPLHAPTFGGDEKAYVVDAIDSTFVSSVGAYVDRFEELLRDRTGSPAAIATVNGTAALYTALYDAGVRAGDLVITQALTFVATCNALLQLGAEPVFADIEPGSLGLCPDATEEWLEEHAVVEADGRCVERATGKAIRAVVPMHTFGHPVQLDELVSLCDRWHLALIEDAAESLGSSYKGWHTGTFGEYGALSFNGNKVVTTGGGGAVLCRDPERGRHVKHLTTTAKVPHAYEFVHDEQGFNYRMPNLNAALGCAQLESLSAKLEDKRELAGAYRELFAGGDWQFVDEPDYAHSNFWLNAVICPDLATRDAVLETTNAAGVMTRPVWRLMTRLPMFESARRGKLDHSEWAEARAVNLPSTPRRDVR